MVDRICEFEGVIEWAADDENDISHDCDMDVAIKCSVEVEHDEDGDFWIGNVTFLSMEEITKNGRKPVESECISTIQEVFIEDYLYETLADQFSRDGW